MANIVNKNLLPKLVVEYINELLVIKASSKLTVDEYLSDLRLFFRYLVSVDKKFDSPDELPQDFDLSFIDTDYISKITLRDINNFLTYCGSDRENSPNTRARKASSIRGFFKYISDKMQYIDHNPATQLQVAPSKKKLPKYLTLEQSIALLNSVKEPNKERDYCILTLFLNCGLRLAELVSLDISDIDFSENTMIVTGKGDKERIVYLNKACVDSIKSYLAVRPHDKVDPKDKNALFLSRLNKRIGRQAVQLMVYHYLKEIGLDGQNYSVHKLRHTAATLMYQHGGVDILVLKDMLGHENLVTTEIYTHLEKRQLRDAAKSNPLSKEFKKSKTE